MAVDKTSAITYHVIPVDVQMPFMNGETATKRLSYMGMIVPFLALTANAMEGFEVKMSEVGYTDFLKKPVDLDAMLQILGVLLDCQIAETVEPQFFL